jgi:hypothetical protein
LVKIVLLVAGLVGSAKTPLQIVGSSIEVRAGLRVVRTRVRCGCLLVGSLLAGWRLMPVGVGRGRARACEGARARDVSFA